MWPLHVPTPGNKKCEHLNWVEKNTLRLGKLRFMCKVSGTPPERNGRKWIQKADLSQNLTYTCKKCKEEFQADFRRGGMRLSEGDATELVL